MVMSTWWLPPERGGRGQEERTWLSRRRDWGGNSKKRHRDSGCDWCVYLSYTDAVPSMSTLLSHNCPRREVCHCHPHFTDEETEAASGHAAGPQSSPAPSELSLSFVHVTSCWSPPLFPLPVGIYSGVEAWLPGPEAPWAWLSCRQ